jgi:DNA-binding NarL/FixJ family response regulator
MTDPDAAPDSRQATILTVEDDDAVRRSIREHLEDQGHHVLEARDGREGLDAFAACAPALVLLDLRMPRMGGLDVLRAIRRDAPDAPVVVISGVGTIEDAVEALRLGAWDYLIKPIEEMSVLDHAVGKALERARLIAENRRYREHLEEQVRRRTAELYQANEQLEHKNLALQEVLNSVQEEKRGVTRKIVHNFEKVIMPLLQSLKQGLDRRQERIAEQLEEGLMAIASPFVDRLSRRLAGLTPTEIRICHLIRQGLAAKEIAQVEHLSTETVSTHRKNIRRKLGLTHRKVSLEAYLEEITSDDGSD